MPTLDQLIDFFKDAQHGSDQYVRYVRNIDKKNGGQTVAWILDVVQNSEKKTVKEVIDKYDSFVLSSPSINWTSKTIDNYRTGLKKFSEVSLGFFSANAWFTRKRGKGFYLCQLIAENAIFASKKVRDLVVSGKLGTNENKKNGGNPFASWDCLLHIRDSKKKGVKSPCTINKFGYVIADDNTIANQAIKRAIIESFNIKYGKSFNLGLFDSFKDYEVCHIWDMPTDPRYYACIENLVLIPRGLAGLSDHNDDVKGLLRYEAKQRFGFVPEGKTAPGIPPFYKQIKWRFDKNFFESSITGPVQSQ